MTYREQLDTPALVVFDDVLKRNLKQMADYASSQGIELRPHFKTHKTAEVARMQKELGAAGVTCAKLGEAEALAETGIFDSIFIANQIVGEIKLKRLAALMERVPHVRVAVDSLEVSQGLQGAMADAGKTLDVVIELNTGQGRAGILPEEALKLADKIREMSNLKLVGLMTHEGHAGKTMSKDELRDTSIAAGKQMVETAEKLRERGFDISVVSVGSTPAAFETTQVEGITEMRPGTYVFQDNTIFRFGDIGPDDVALRILATVTSRPSADRAILDTGSKVLTTEPSQWKEGFGYIVQYPEAEIFSLSEEHGWVSLPESCRNMKIGEKIEIIPNHVCPTVNLTDELYLVRDGEVAETWPVIARGKVR